MEGLTGFPFRRIHHECFGGADAYYLPFVTPTVKPAFTDRQMRELAPAVNAGFRAVPQLLTRSSADFLWAAKALSDLGYDEVNLNLGCPAGTVVAKGKGSGFLKTPYELDAFLHTVFNAELKIAISVKTRIGWSDEDEFERLAQIYNRYPIKHLTIHPRLRQDHYKGELRRHVFDEYYHQMSIPLGYNGDVITESDINAVNCRYPDLALIMVGRALMADPALFRKAKGGAAATRQELIDWAQILLDTHIEAFGSVKNAMMRMKEYWFFLHNLFEGSDKLVKGIYKAKTLEDYEATVCRITQDCPLRTQSLFAWFKPL